MDPDITATVSIEEVSCRTPPSNMDDGQIIRESTIGDTAPPLAVTSSTESSHAVPTIDDVQNESPSIDRNSNIRVRLDRELALSRTNRLQLQSYWRQVLVKEKFQELHDEIPHLIKCHDENVARKEELIDSLHVGIKCLRELHRDAMNANMSRINNFIAVHNGQVGKWERDFRDRVSTFQSQYRKDVEAINSHYGDEKEAIRRCIRMQAETDERRITVMRQEHNRELEEIRNRNRDIIDDLRSIMDSKLVELGEQFERTHGEFAENTDGTRIEYDQLKSRRLEPRCDMRASSKGR
jgi:hypothetical protein